MTSTLERINVGPSEIDLAIEMAEWFADYLYGVIGQPGQMPALTIERLKRQLGDGDPTEQIATIRDTIMIFDDDHQTNLALYFCGYPNQTLDMLASEDTPVESSIDQLDAIIPPPNLLVETETPEPKPPTVSARVQQALASISVYSAASHTSNTDWMDNALCRQVDPEIFFPGKGESTREAVNVCDECPVRAECLQYSLDTGERFGIWGGLSERGRRKLAKQLAKVASAE